MNIEKIAAVKTGRYQFYADEIVELLQHANNNEVVDLDLAYRYGFMRGQNSAKANARKKAVQA